MAAASAPLTLWQAQEVVRRYGMVENLVRHSQQGGSNKVEGMGFATARQLAQNRIHTLSQLLYCYASCGESWLASLCDQPSWRENVALKLSPGLREMLTSTGYRVAEPEPAAAAVGAAARIGSGESETLRGMMEEIRMLRDQLQSVCETIVTQRPRRRRPARCQACQRRLRGRPGSGRTRRRQEGQEEGAGTVSRRRCRWSRWSRRRRQAPAQGGTEGAAAGVRRLRAADGPHKPGAGPERSPRSTRGSSGRR